MTTEICFFFHFQLIKSVDSKFLKLTQLDDEIYEEFRKEHPAFNVDVLNEEELKSPSAKVVCSTVKPVLSGHSKRTQKLVFKTDYCLMQVKSIAECSKGSILQYFRPSLSYHFSLRPLFCILLSGRLRQVLLYSLDHTFLLHAFTFAGSRGRCLNTRLIG